jgi:hypothetical protein
MKLKRIILISLILIQVLPLFSQSVAFTYDSTGNRLTRTIVVQKLQSNETEFPVVDAKALIPVESAIGAGASQAIEDKESSQDSKFSSQEKSLNEKSIMGEGELITLVYPNPSKGLLKVEISNMPASSTNEMILYDLNGMELISKKNFDSYSELDISQFKDGIYILRIIINKNRFDWKIIKGQ